MEKTLHQILTELRGIRQELRQLQRSIVPNHQVVEAMLRRRGIYAVKYAPRDHLVLPLGSSQTTEDEFYDLMKKYSFRLFLRDLIAYIDDLNPKYLTRYCSEDVAEHYLSILVHHNILVPVSSNQYQFITKRLPIFGDTLEWFVEQVLEREFASPASWGIRLKDTEVGGDYDVIASVEGRFVYIEVKSSPPKHIEFQEITAFVDRVQNLRPDCAIFLEDTHLRMKDKLVVLFEEEMRRRYGEQAQQAYPVKRLHDEIFSINDVIFITNTKPHLISNIGICFKQFFARGL